MTPKRGMFPYAPNSAFCAMGVGTQIIYIDPENDLVIVARWIEKEKVPEFVRMVLASIKNNNQTGPDNFLLTVYLRDFELQSTQNRKTNYELANKPIKKQLFGSKGIAKTCIM